ncbi:MAG: STAS domain-containing protein [Pseudomonadales bacterium]|uniref:STAS domain anti-sigma-factor antagonist n=1 Tax=Oleiphilus messinensis TaxID=141451 RepID=A0A1Y0IAP8_9GAMM|nr:STAS domain-containing protein [Oleiphilus messinensis]ARU57578.1 STAS domain anti-sigma-factor antagonist [Oleiphilus messinensis]MCG8613487.1 STAS domain-containing protein [Pseudomonadales bacterium]
MSISTSLSADGGVLTIKIQGRFDFSSHQEFRDAYESSDDNVKEYVIDMTEATYLDSSALGMLLLLRDFAGGDSAKVSITNCNHDVKKILTISNFEQLFDIK